MENQFSTIKEIIEEVKIANISLDEIKKELRQALLKVNNKPITQVLLWETDSIISLEHKLVLLRTLLRKVNIDTSNSSINLLDVLNDYKNQLTQEILNRPYTHNSASLLDNHTRAVQNETQAEFIGVLSGWIRCLNKIHEETKESEEWEFIMNAEKVLVKEYCSIFDNVKILRK